MARLRAEALVGGAEDLLSQPRCIVDHRRLGTPGDSVDADGGGTLLRVEEMPLSHVDVDPDVRERLSHLLDDEHTVFVHYVD
ncbi:hypothetical protein [Halobaculum rubrum]|uniref:hypothetical protein n=1 Tax=Halobaculum rubrum TaxID=2872158 RepID=UPI001CA3CE25|nr:hypothetical protein [Halobaculum rubrum]QZX98652.1 hypothetical protein K6T25_10220 [Halobaculum rubrum]